jgi:hypothetical protein
MAGEEGTIKKKEEANETGRLLTGIHTLPFI